MRQWLEALVGESLAPIVAVILSGLIVILLVLAVIAMFRKALGGGLGIGSRGQMPRLAVLDAIGVDQKRKLVLVRRDEVEHLILIGGPNDVVVEPQILRVPAAIPGRQREPGGRAEPALAVEPPRRANAQLQSQGANAPGAAPVVAPPPVAMSNSAGGAPGGNEPRPPVPPAATPRREEPRAEPRRPAPAPEVESPAAAVSRRTEPAAVPPVPSPAPIRREPAFERPSPVVAPPEPSLEGPRQPLRPALPPREAVREPMRPQPAPVPAGPPRSMATPVAPPPMPEPAAARPVNGSQPAMPVPGAAASGTARTERPIRDEDGVGASSPILDATGEPVRQPLSVRSFASTIQNHRSDSPPPRPAAPPVAAPAPVAAPPPAPAPSASRNEEDSDLADLLAVEFGAPPQEPDAREPVAHPENRDRDVNPADADRREDSNIEDEMERLLRDFTLDPPERR